MKGLGGGRGREQHMTVLVILFCRHNCPAFTMDHGDQIQGDQIQVTQLYQANKRHQILQQRTMPIRGAAQSRVYRPKDTSLSSELPAARHV